MQNFSNKQDQLFHTSKKMASIHGQEHQNLENLFNPYIKVVPENDWSAIKAIWIPFLHHDYKNELQRLEKIIILQPLTDKFGTVQGYLLACNENYIPYLTTFFNPQLTPHQVIDLIMQACNNIVETEYIVIDSQEKTIRKNSIGATTSGMLIAITQDSHDKIIDAYPLFDQKTI